MTRVQKSLAKEFADQQETPLTAEVEPVGELN